MSKGYLRIVIDREPPAFAPGERIAGWLQVRAFKPLVMHAIDVALVLNQVDQHAYQIVQEGRLAAGEHSFPFALATPLAPRSYHGAHLQLRWAVHAKADGLGWGSVSSERMVTLDVALTELGERPSIVCHLRQIDARRCEGASLLASLAVYERDNRDDVTQPPQTTCVHRTERRVTLGTGQANEELGPYRRQSHSPEPNVARFELPRRELYPFGDEQQGLYWAIAIELFRCGRQASPASPHVRRALSAASLGD